MAINIPAQNGVNCVQVAFMEAAEYLDIVPMPCVVDVHKALMIPEGTRKQDIPTLAIMYLPGVSMTMIAHPAFAHEGNNWVAMLKATSLHTTIDSYRAYIIQLPFGDDGVGHAEFHPGKLPPVDSVDWILLLH